MRLANAPPPQTFADFRAHWTALKGAARAPSLSAFLDKPIPHLQPWITIFDVEEDDSPIRLFGTSVVNFTGADYTGGTLADIIAAEERPELQGLNRTIADQCCGSVTVVRCSTTGDREVELRVIGLPLLRRDGASVVWLNEPSAALSLGETGKIVRRVIYQEWIDLGYGVPGN